MTNAKGKADDRAVQSWRKVLTSHGWLSRVPEDFRSALLADADWQSFEAGEHLFLAGEENRREMLGLCEGVVAIAAGMGPADTPPLHLLRPASWFGYSTLFTGEATRVSATARTKVWVARIAGNRVQQCLAGNPEWWPCILALVALYGDAAVTVAADLAIRGSERRLVAVLLRLSGHRHPAAGPVLGVVPISQAELAAACNLSRNTTSTILLRLAANGLLALARGGVEVRKPDALMKIAAL